MAGTVSINDVIIVEGNSGTKTAIFSVIRSGGTDAFSVTATTSNGTATTADGDYASKTEVLSFGAGVNQQTFSVVINGDTKFEPSETFNVNLSNATNGTVINDGQGRGTISNDDAAPPAVSINDVIIVEGNTGTKTAIFVVNRSGGTAAFSVTATTSNGTATTADGDYASKTEVLSFGAGVNQQTFSVVINGDTKFEPSETFNVNLSNATNGANISDGTGVGTISNDDVNDAANDFNGDGRSDILFSNTGAVFASNYVWQMNDRAIASQGAIGLYDKSFSVQVVGDFNGDGKSDVVLENPATGGVWQWQLNGTAIASQGAVDVGDPSYRLLGSGDFNGDGKDDLLWRNNAGFVYEWLMNGRVDTPAAVQLLDPSWRIVGSGDFDGDNKADLLLRNISNTSENGAFFLWQMNGNQIKAQGGIERPGTDWQILGVGDFDGDGKADFAVRHVSNFQPGEAPGAVWVYLMDGNTIKSQGAAGIADASVFDVAGIGDYNGDGKDDIMFRNDTGYFYSWDMNGTTIKSEGAILWADPNQHVVTQLWDVV